MGFGLLEEPKTQKTNEGNRNLGGGYCSDSFCFFCLLPLPPRTFGSLARVEGRITRYLRDTRRDTQFPYSVLGFWPFKSQTSPFYIVKVWILRSWSDFLFLFFLFLLPAWPPALFFLFFSVWAGRRAILFAISRTSWHSGHGIGAKARK